MEKIKRTILQILTTGSTQGNWDATTNIPDITITNDTGYMWYVSVSGNTVLGDISTWDVGDWAVRLDDGWGKLVDFISGSSGNTIIIPDLSVLYNFKIGLRQSARDLGFFDAYSEPSEPVPEPPEETFYLVDSASNIFYDPSDSENFIYE